MALTPSEHYHLRMDDERIYQVRATFKGDRIVVGPLTAEQTIDNCFAMREAGYSSITVTNTKSGHVSNLSEWSSEWPTAPKAPDPS